jgi:hypothetical protein
MKIEPGDRFSFAAEGIFGTVDEVFRDLDGEPVSAVIELDNGKWASADLTKLEAVTVH